MPRISRVRAVASVLSVPLLAVGGLVAAVQLPSAAGAAADPIDSAVTASAAPGHSWSPEPASYGVTKQLNVPVRMSDGVVLRADIATPADPTTGTAAAGPFPVLLTQTPYGKDVAGQAQSAAIGIDPYFVKRGYIDVAVDVRGTGGSGGRFDLFDPKQTDDGVALVNWAARLPHSSGLVGLHGASYLGINQLLTAGAVGKNSPLKAIFPIVAANDVYRDTAFMGGIPDSEFDVIYYGGLLPLVNLTGPLVTALVDPRSAAAELNVLLQHLHNTAIDNLPFLLKTYLGDANSYDNAYWQAKSPGNVLPQVVANGIPAYLVGGEYDLFQRGEPLNYAGLQNAWSGRPATAPMTAGQPVTGRYQLLDGPFTHLGAAIGTTAAMHRLMLEWFDTWLRGADTGMAQTATPLHYYDLGTGQYANTTTYPISGATPSTYYFSGQRSGSALSQNDGTLTTSVPTSGSDRLLWSLIGSSICDRSLDQWAMGAFTLVTGKLHPVPCFDDDRLGQTGPTALTYTTAPMTHARTIAGPIDATIYASANTSETEWVVNVEDVAPNGVSKPLTQGALLGSQRALDPARSWRVQGNTLMPYHPYTKAAAQAVPKGAVTRYDVEVFPTYSTIAPGHRIRVTVDSTDFPHLAPTPAEGLKLLGGVYQVQRGGVAASSVTLPLIG